MGQRYSPINIEFHCKNCDTTFVIDFSVVSDDDYITKKTALCPACGTETENYTIRKLEELWDEVSFYRGTIK